jgi:hypothetical protein
MEAVMMSDLKQKIFESVGAASMCWEPRPSSQVFDSTKAKEIGDSLYASVETELAAITAEREEKMERVRKAAEARLLILWQSTEIAKMKQRIRVLEDALHWYAGTGKRGEFSIVDANNAWIGDLVDWGDKARAALSKAREASDDKGGATSSDE